MAPDQQPIRRVIGRASRCRCERYAQQRFALTFDEGTPLFRASRQLKRSEMDLSSRYRWHQSWMFCYDQVGAQASAEPTPSS